MGTHIKSISGEDWRPGAKIPVIRWQDDERTLSEMRWGLIPNWAKSEHLEYSTYDARSEGIASTPAYRDAWRRGQRCLVPADGFFERDRYFTSRSGGLMMIAGVWDEWDPIGLPLRSCSMITTRSNDLVGLVHNRMPVIIAAIHWAKWLGETSAAEPELRAMFEPFPADLMCVGTPLVNRIRPEAIKISANQRIHF